MPCDFPEYFWNVEDSQMVGRSRKSDQSVPHMRRGTFGNFMVAKGPFRVKFSDGTLFEPT